MEDANGNDPKLPGQNNNSAASSEAPAQNTIPQQQASLISESLDLACNQLIEEISIKVMLEKDEGVDDERHYSPLTAADLATYNATVGSQCAIPPSAIPRLALQEVDLEAGEGSTSIPAPLSSAERDSLQPWFGQEITSSTPCSQPPSTEAADSMLFGIGEADTASAVAVPALTEMTGTTVASPEAAAADDAAFADLLSGDEAAAAALTPPGDPFAAGASPKEMPNGMSVADSSPTWIDNMTPQIIAAVEVATAPLVGSPPAAFSQREKKEEEQGEKEEALVVVPPEAAATAPPTHPPAKKAILKPLRRSSRSAALADEHTLLKAERLTAKRNLETPGHLQGSVLVTLLGTAAA
ncbi:hypothetical protein BS78_05G067100 [Paspalum vaginatum]|nr:hypothetical protein BS78_05G067100 [Paspalum vaginatum]